MTLSDLPEIPRVSKFAYASIAFAIGNFLCIPLPVIGGPLAIYCGYMARKAIRASDGKITGTAMANWGIILGLGGTLLMFVIVGGLAPAFPALMSELDKIHGIVGEFKEAYAKNDAAALHAKLSAPARDKLSIDELSKKLEFSAKQFGMIDEFSFRWWSFMNQSYQEGDPIRRFPYKLKGPKGDFLGAFYCRKLDDGSWKLERFEFELE